MFQRVCVCVRERERICVGVRTAPPLFYNKSARECVSGRDNLSFIMKNVRERERERRECLCVWERRKENERKRENNNERGRKKE
jgi:hypothetical protein